jgi:hypothetical protein
MIVAKNVERPMDYKSQQLLASRYAQGFGVFPCDFDADVDVSYNGTPSPDPAESERNHVGWTVVPEVTMVKLRHCCSPNERNR